MASGKSKSHAIASCQLRHQQSYMTGKKIKARPIKKAKKKK